MGTTNYIWHGDSVLMETDETGATTATYTREPDKYGSLISQHRGGQTHVHHYDGLGSTTELTDSTGTVTDTFRYSGFGNQIKRTGTTQTPHTYVGRSGYQKDEPKRFYIRRRHYDPVVDRWLSQDPELFADGVNRFVYSANSPVIHIDPSGTLILTARIYATAAFHTRWNHLCLEADIYVNCSGCPLPQKVETYQIELLAAWGGGRAPLSARVGVGSAALGPLLSSGAVIRPVRDSWGIFVVPGGSCDSANARKVGSVAATYRQFDANGNPIGFGFEDQEAQCRLADCLIAEALNVGTAANRRSMYHLTRRNSNSFISQVLRRCGAHVNDEFMRDAVLPNKAVGWRYNFA